MDERKRTVSTTMRQTGKSTAYGLKKLAMQVLIEQSAYAQKGSNPWPKRTRTSHPQMRNSKPRTYELKRLSESVRGIPDAFFMLEEKASILSELFETHPIIEELQRRGCGTV
jgi:hypothetical protein